MKVLILDKNRWQENENGWGEGSGNLISWGRGLGGGAEQWLPMRGAGFAGGAGFNAPQNCVQNDGAGGSYGAGSGDGRGLEE